jgi:hypothetical protein
LERTIAESAALGERLKPHPKLPGAHLLDWHGNWQEVTFSAKLFDEHPNTLKLLSYGSGLLEDVLSVVESPHDDRRNGVIARCSVDGAWSASGYFRLNDASAVPTLDKLRTALDDSSTTPVTPQQQHELETRFADSVHCRLTQDDKAANDRRNAQLSSLTEEIRQLLVEAAYIELALATHRDLFDEALPLDFSEQAFQRLKRHKVPFAGAIKLAGAGLPRPRPDDPLFIRLRESKKDVLLRRFDGIRGKLTERLRDLIDARNHTPAASHATATKPALNCYGVSSAFHHNP